MNHSYLLIDIGGSAIKYALCDENLNLTDKGKAELAQRSPKEDFFKAIEDLYHQFEGVEGVAISMPGLIDERSGFCAGSSMLKEGGFNVAEELTQHLNIPVSVVNDGYAAALAELGYGNMQNAENGLVMVLGTGIGGAVILNHELFVGSHHMAGNFSFIYSDVYHPEDRGTQFGFINGINGLKDAVKETSGIEDADGIRTYQLIDAGNEEVRKGLELFCDRLAFQIYNLQIMLDVEKVLIGGGLSNDPRTIEYVKEAAERRWKSAMIPTAMPKIENCKYSNDANLLGALYNWKQHYE